MKCSLQNVQILAPTALLCVFYLGIKCLQSKARATVLLSLETFLYVYH